MKRIIIPAIIAVGCMAVLNIFGIAKPPVMQQDAVIKPITTVVATETIQARAVTPVPTVIVTTEPTAEPTPTSEEPTITATPEPVEEEPVEEPQVADPAPEPQESPELELEPESEEPLTEETESSTEPVGEPDMEYLGAWTVTAYCGCEICCGSWSGSPTASGVYPTAWHTIACSEFPFGTILYIDGYGYFTVEDRGVYGAWIDMYFDDHDEADAFGMQTIDVYLVH